MATPPPIPPVPDSDRYWSATLGITPIASAAVPFPIYGDGTDLDILFNGTPLAPSFWSFVSASAPGTPLDSLPRPITDGQILFSPPVYGGLLEIIGDAHPRQVAMPTAPGIARREFNQAIGNITSTMREFWRGLKSQKAGAISFNATGPLASRAQYDTVTPPFLFLQTDDAQSRPVYYAKLSANTADWSGPLVAVGPQGTAGTNGNNGINGTNGAYAATDGIAASIAPTDYVPAQIAGISKRVSRDTLLRSVSPSFRVSSLWTGDGQGITTTGASAALVVMADGTPRAWGAGNDSGNGDAQGGVRVIPKTVTFDPANAVQPTLPIVQCARAGSSMFLLDSAGLVFAAGGNAVGQLGVGDIITRRRFTLITALQSAGLIVSSIVTEPATWDVHLGSTVYFLTTAGQLYACGANGSGQIGDGTTSNKLLPVRCGTITNIVKVVPAGNYNGGASNFVMALDNAGNLYAWGQNQAGQIGDGTTSNRSAPYQTLTGVVDVAISMGANASATLGGHAVAVMTNGSVRTVGFNFSGQLGLGDTTSRPNWTVIVGITTAVKAFAGGGPYGISAVILSDGTLRIWGANYQGCIGNGGTTSVLVPYSPSGAFQGKVLSVHIHGNYAQIEAIALLCTDGTVWVAGYNGTGALAQSNGLANIGIFTQIVFPPNVTAKATVVKFLGGTQGDASLMVLLSDGSLWASGANGDSRLGTQVWSLHTTDAMERVIFT